MGGRLGEAVPGFDRHLHHVSKRGSRVMWIFLYLIKGAVRRSLVKGDRFFVSRASQSIVLGYQEG